MDSHKEQPGKKPWTKPEIESDMIYETRALGCAQCLNGRPGTEVGWGEGNCASAVDDY